ncbi:MAG: cell surface protein, partial [Paludibacteraceae bacterium]|nr:cell surface protein [Paludibacteraceae bacterium]
SSTDRTSTNSKANRFDISNAIDANGNLVELDFIDFVKVQTAVNSKSDWLGEMSTEVVGFFDYSMKKE